MAVKNRKSADWPVRRNTRNFYASCAFFSSVYLWFLVFFSVRRFIHFPLLSPRARRFASAYLALRNRIDLLSDAIRIKARGCASSYSADRIFFFRMPHGTLPERRSRTFPDNIGMLYSRSCAGVLWLIDVQPGCVLHFWKYRKMKDIVKKLK